MKYFNRLLITLALMYISVLVFNTVSAWLGMFIFAAIVYANVYMLIQANKEKKSPYQYKKGI